MNLNACICLDDSHLIRFKTIISYFLSFDCRQVVILPIDNKPFRCQCYIQIYLNFISSFFCCIFFYFETKYWSGNYYKRKKKKRHLLTFFNFPILRAKKKYVKQL